MFAQETPADKVVASAVTPVGQTVHGSTTGGQQVASAFLIAVHETLSTSTERASS